MTGDVETNGNKVGVAYTVKELLSNLNDKIDRIESKLDNKVDRTELEVLISKLIILETKLATAEALKMQENQIGQVYLRQWESMQSVVADHTTKLSNIDVVTKKAEDWKVLWYPIAVLVISNIVFAYIALRGVI